MSMYVYVFWLFLSLARAQLNPEDEAKIDEFMEGIRECTGMPGASIALVKDNEAVLTKGYGLADVETEVPVTADTVFAIASVSKSFSATLLSKLFSEENLGLDWDSVASWASADLTCLYDGYVTNHTAFRDLLSHQTGIPRNDAIWALQAFPRRNDLVERTRFMQPYREFRSDFLYNNIMYLLASHPIEVLTSLSFEELFQSQLFDLIGMDSTTFYNEAAGENYEGFATPYYWDIVGGNPDNLTAVPMDTWLGAALIGPAASVCSTANDMAKWMAFILNGGIDSDGSVIMNPSDLTRLWYPESAYRRLGYPLLFEKPNAPVTDSYENYGLGYLLGHYRGYQTFSHSGDLSGYHSEVYFIPDMNISSFFTTNFGGTSVERSFAHQFFADVLLGYEPVYNASVVCEVIANLDPFELPQYDIELIPDQVKELLFQLGVRDHLLDYFVRQYADGATAGLPKNTALGLVDVINEYKYASYLPEHQHAVENYTGVYGNYAHGNLTVALSEQCPNCLTMDYGNALYTMYPTETEDVFVALSNNIVFYNVLVIFSGFQEETGEVLYITPVTFEIFSPPMFERGLDISDAPPPNIDAC